MRDLFLQEDMEELQWGYYRGDNHIIFNAKTDSDNYEKVVDLFAHAGDVEVARWSSACGGR